LNCLVLNPINPINLSQDKQNIVDTLSTLDIIGNTILKDNNDYFLAGQNYLQYISFLGCAPNIKFEQHTEISLSDLKQTIADLNYIQFDFMTNNYCFKKTDFGIKAICPSCKTIILKWSEMIKTWEINYKTELACPNCNEIISILDVNWKKTAGFYQSAILFHGIQTELALPTDTLLTQLEKITNVKWQYFYAN